MLSSMSLSLEIGWPLIDSSFLFIVVPTFLNFFFVYRGLCDILAFFTGVTSNVANDLFNRLSSYSFSNSSGALHSTSDFAGDEWDDDMGSHSADFGDGVFARLLRQVAHTLCFVVKFNEGLWFIKFVVKNRRPLVIFCLCLPNGSQQYRL